MLVLTAQVEQPGPQVPKVLQAWEPQALQALLAAMGPPGPLEHPERLEQLVPKALPGQALPAQPVYRAPLVHWEQLVPLALALTEPRVLRVQPALQEPMGQAVPQV